MKLSVIGGGSVRTPLLIKNLLERNNPDLETIALFDTDPEKMQLIKPILDEISEHLKVKKNIQICTSFEEMAENTDFVFSSFRQGGDQGRILDESIPDALGMLGQETVGAGGAAMALRTLPVALDYAEKLHRIAPDAWLINFTNPSGILTEALLNHSSHDKIVGICDAPIVIKNMAASYLNCPVDDIDFRTFGLNHLGWVYDVTLKGKPILGQLIEEAEKFVETEPLYRNLLDHIKETRLIPNEYLLFYLHSEDVRKKYAGESYKRSQYIADINQEFYRSLKKGNVKALDAYQEYLEKREGSYMAVETGNAREKQRVDIFARKNKFGYDDVAISVMDALRGKGDTVLPVNRKNDSCSYLERSDVLEVDSHLHKGGYSEGFEVPELPERCVSLIKNVKAYERKLVEGYMKKDRSLILEAFGYNPLIKSEKAQVLLDEIIASHKLEDFPK